jgi:hypothetical protein
MDKGDRILEIMASGSEHVRAMHVDLLSITANELNAMPLTEERMMAIVVPMIRERKAGDPIPQVGDFLRALRREVREITTRPSRASDPSSWLESTRRMLAYLHEGSTLRGPVGLLAELIAAAGMSEDEMIREMKAVALKCGEWVPRSPNNPFAKTEEEKNGLVLEIDRPAAMQRLNAILWLKIQRLGDDPERVVMQWEQDQRDSASNDRSRARAEKWRRSVEQQCAVIEQENGDEA